MPCVTDQSQASADTVDWEAIERSPDFQELVNDRRRFAWTGGTIGVGLGALYVVLAGVAPDLMGTQLFGSMSLGFVGGVGLIVLTWVITLAYMRRSDKVWGPLEERIREQERIRDQERAR
jgi:uncharacterized membrane protein (DUF485 family)